MHFRVSLHFHLGHLGIAHVVLVAIVRAGGDRQRKSRGYEKGEVRTKDARERHVRYTPSPYEALEKSCEGQMRCLRIGSEGTEPNE